MPSKLYKIHPAIGICRIGNSNEYFVGPESIDSVGVEIQTDNSEIPITDYKSSGKIKKQGARFRVYEYEVDDSGVETVIGEVDGLQITWMVNVINSKGAGNKLKFEIENNRRILLPKGNPRNQNVSDRSKLIIKPGEKTVTGLSATPVELDGGEFLGESVSLGSIFTDYSGRLIVLGGEGISQGIPETVGGSIPELGSFVDNNRWYDDVSDGTVKATVSLSDGTEVDTVSAWVVCAPPDFAPEAHAPVSMYDIMMQAGISRGWKATPQIPSYMRDVFPILKRSSTMRWIDNFNHWSDITLDWEALGKKNNEWLREDAYDAITEATLNQMAIPPHMITILDSWLDGIFVEDYDPNYSYDFTPEHLDRAALEACIGTSFYPGIELGALTLDDSLFSEIGRISPVKVKPGQLSAQMALPWQADFNDCDTDWWPSQRPTNIYTDESSVPNLYERWGRGVAGSGIRYRKEMVEKFWRLGFIVPSPNGSLIEKERDDNLPN